MLRKCFQAPCAVYSRNSTSYTFYYHINLSSSYNKYGLPACYLHYSITFVKLTNAKVQPQLLPTHRLNGDCLKSWWNSDTARGQLRKISAKLTFNVEGLAWVFSSDLIMSSTDGFVGRSCAESTVYAVESVKVSPVQDHLQVWGMDCVCQTCWQSVGLLCCTTWAGAQPGLIIGELLSLVSLRMVDRILSYCHVLYRKDKSKSTPAQPEFLQRFSPPQSFHSRSEMNSCQEPSGC